MPTVIDSLVVELGLDPKKFTQGQKEALARFKELQEASRKGGKETEEAGRRIMDGFTAIKREALGLFGAFFGGRGVKEFVSYITSVDAAAGRMSKTLGMSVSQLTAWQGVAKLTGGSAESITGSMQGLTDQINRFMLTGEGSFLPILNVLNISLFDANKHLKTAGQLFLELSHAVQGMDPARARALLSGLGIDAATINTLLAGDAAIKQLLSDQEKLGHADDENAKSAIELSKAWNEAEQSATSLGRTILSHLTPALVGLLNRWTDIFAELRKGYIISPNSLVGRLLGLKYAPGDEKELNIRKGPIDWLAEEVAPTSSVRTVPAGTPGAQINPETGQWYVDGAAPAPSEAAEPTTPSPASLDAWLRDYLRGGPHKAPHKISGATGDLADSAFGRLIARGEGDYNSVNLGVKGGYRASTADLASMTLADVMAAQRRGDFNAAGRYQITRDTIAGAAKTLGLTGAEKFDKALQDRIFSDYLIAIKRKPLGDYLSGRSNDVNAAALAAAQEWASVEDPRTGRSFYDGVGNNRASISAAQVTEALKASRTPGNAWTGIPYLGAGIPLAGASAAALASSSAVDNSKTQGDTTVTNSTTIGTVNVNAPRATDAVGIAKEIPSAIKRASMAAQANYGQI